MKPEKKLSNVFVGLFIFLWIMGPLTQLLQIINLPLHVELGLSEKIILQPEFGWLKSDELAIAWADMTYLIAGIIFVIGSFLRKPWSVPFGLYTSAIWFFIMLLARVRWSLLEMNGFGVLKSDQMMSFYTYSYIYIIFGLFGMYYLWKNRNIYNMPLN